VFEALFHGDDRYSFDRDPGAVVLWLDFPTDGGRRVSGL